MNGGAARVWMSADGRHWAEPHFSQQHRPPHVSHIGVFHPEKREKARITVKSISLRPFTAVRALASPAALERAPEIAEQPTLPAWVAHTLAARPSDIEEGDWLRACAVQTLARGCSRDFGWELFRRLFQSARELPGETRLAALEEAALVLPVLDDAGRLQQTVDMFLEAADDAGGPYALAHLPLMTAPLLSWHRFQPFDAEAVRAELLGLLYAGKWHETLELCRRLRFFEATRQLPFVSWADFTAQRELPGHGAGLNLNSLKPEWQQPLVEELSKDAYNLQAELRAILESDAIDDAVRLMTSVEPNLIEGVAPSFSDRRLLVSLPISLRLAAQEHPSLRDSMQRQFGELAALRVRQALSAGDESAVELAALQFDGTSAAAEAHQWLGDRALSAGRFHIALAEYRRASETSSALLRHDLAARQRLAAAFLGREFGEPASRTVRLGEMVVSAEEFEAICGQMRARGAEGAHANLESVPVIPPVGAMKAEAKARFDGASGQNPNDRVDRKSVV